MARQISFASFNLYNLQLPNKRWRFNEYTPEQYEDKVNWTSHMLKLVDADVYAFQELWSKECIHDVFSAAGLSDQCEFFFINDSWRDIAVCAAVRRPLVVEDVIVHKNFPEGFRLVKRNVDHAISPVVGEDDDIEVVINKFSRSVLQLSIKHPDFADDPNMQLFSIHLKSKLPTDLDDDERGVPETKKHAGALGAALSTIRRVSEAAALRMILTNQLKGSNTPAIVIGDFNDSVTSNALAIITSQAKYRLYETSNIANRSDVGLYSSAIMQNFRSIRDSTYTHVHDGMKDTLDHILFSEQFYPHSRNRLWSFKEMNVWNDHVGDNTKVSSDHGIIKTTFERS